MAKPPPARIIAVAERARAGLTSLRRIMVPPGIALLDCINDFWSFNIVFALAELRVVDALRAGPRSSDDVARELGTAPDHTYRLLRSGSMLGLVSEAPGRVFSLKPVGEALCEDPKGSFRDFIVFEGRYGSRFWRRLPDCVREGKTAIELETGQKPFEFLTGEPEVLECFNRAMTAVSNLSCEAIVSAYDFSRLSRLVDVGGGHGRLLGEILRKTPVLRGVLFDLPKVVAGVPALALELGVASRVEVVEGNFFESVPEGADGYIAKSIIHDWGDDEARTILRNVRRAIRADGRLLLAESVVPDPNQPHFAKLLDIEMVVMGGGRERSEAEYRSLLHSTGFELLRVVPTAGPLSLLESRPV